jgi:folate-binding protein YgfZ
MGVATETDYALLSERAGIVRRSRGLITVAGDEAADFLQGQVTNDVEALEPGAGCYAALLTHKGRIRTDMRILRTAEGFLIDLEAIGHPILWKTIETYSLGREVSASDESSSLMVLSVIGPAAEVAGTAVPVPEHGHVEGELGRLVRTDLGIDVICATARAADVIAALDLPEASEDAAECIRIESGRPRLGLDIGGETIPEEAGLNDRAVSFTKGCYVGQETVARLHYRGRPNRQLRGLRLSAPAEPGEAIVAGEREVGSTGSTCVSPARGPLALAVLRREAAPGDTVAVGGDGAPAEVAELPFA